MAERPGCPVLLDLWSYVKVLYLLQIKELNIGPKYTQPKKRENEDDRRAYSKQRARRQTSLMYKTRSKMASFYCWSFLLWNMQG